jgi:hypothetical protein
MPYNYCNNALSISLGRGKDAKRSFRPYMLKSLVRGLVSRAAFLPATIRNSGKLS